MGERIKLGGGTDGAVQLHLSLRSRATNGLGDNSRISSYPWVQFSRFIHGILESSDVLQGSSQGVIGFPHMERWANSGEGS
jgi:hypothetical protein